MTAEEIRKRILDVTLANGGHLASSLGAVELAMALCRVFDPKTDRVVWDVGHQAYAWKILTGRDDSFDTLRRAGGISGFPNPAESPCDAAVAGHAGVAISVALGLASARDRMKSNESVIAVVGDGAIVNGVSFEALNQCAQTTRRLIVVLNDNDMSISRPVGSLAHFFGHLTSGVRYNRAKNAAKKAGRAMRLSFLYGFVHAVKDGLKRFVLKTVYFEQFGLHYLGPVDGHDVDALVSALQSAKEEDRPVLVHVVTRKGRGYEPAEKNPSRYHGVSPAGVKSSGRSWSAIFGDTLSGLARKNPQIVALTAGMKDGTGLASFAAEFPGRFFDVGIAEEHMAAFAAGLAAGGMRPVVAVYSTFLQRMVDQVMHDVCISNLPVVFCVDRAGVVGSDGVPHQGLYDIPMLRCLPNLTICQPKDAADFAALLDEAMKRNGPTVIRYPRGTAPLTSEESSPSAGVCETRRTVIWATGDWLGKAHKVAARIGAEVVHARYLKPFDAERLRAQRAAGCRIVSLENGATAGGFGEAIGADVRFGWPDEFVPHGTTEELENLFGLDVESMVRRLHG